MGDLALSNFFHELANNKKYYVTFVHLDKDEMQYLVSLLTTVSTTPDNLSLIYRIEAALHSEQEAQRLLDK